MSGINGQSGLAQRLRKLPMQIAVALVNATAVLVIAAAILAMVALNRVENAAARISASMTDAVLSKVEVDPPRLLKNLSETRSEIRDLRTALKEGGARRAEQIEQRIAALTETVTGLRDDVKKLTDAKMRLTDAAIREMGNAVSDGLLRLRDCRPVQSGRLPDRRASNYVSNAE